MFRRFARSGQRFFCSSPASGATPKVDPAPSASPGATTPKPKPSPTPPAASAVEKYELAVKVNHWVGGFAVLGAVGGVLGAQQAGKEKFMGRGAGDWMWLHKSCGLLTGMVLLPRLAARLASRAPAHLPGPAPLQFLANVSHVSLYGFMFSMAGTGIAMGYYGGKGLPFFWTKFDGAAQADGAIAKSAFGWHKQIGTYGKYLIPMHVAGTGYHVGMGHAIFGRIVPGL